MTLQVQETLSEGLKREFRIVVPATELDAKVEHVQIGDVEGTVLIIQRHARERHRNVYMPLAVMRPDLPPRQKGFEEDVVAVLGLVPDFDDADAADYARRLPVAAPYVLETSADRFQTFLLFDRPASMAEAKVSAMIAPTPGVVIS